MAATLSPCCEGYPIGLNEAGELICFGCGTLVVKPPKDGPILHGLLQKAANTAHGLKREVTIAADGTVYRMSPIGWRKVGWLMLQSDREDFLLSQLSQEPDLQPRLD